MKRYLSLDLLRGLSIFGMVFSALVPYGVLPSWMYHIQTPPPTHVFDKSVSGISWVDLVFPIFIFCMGVAIPLSGRKKIESAGEKSITSSYVKNTMERFFMLWLFSYLYVFLNFSTAQGLWPQFFTMLGFVLLFPIYYIFGKQVSKQKQLLIKGCGFVAIVLLIALGHFAYNEAISIYRSGIIIFLLAFLYLFGSLIWYFTRDSIRNRLLIFITILLFMIFTLPFEIQEKLYAIKEIRWFFNMEYIYFLLILLPATYIGDLLYGQLAFTTDGLSTDSIPTNSIPTNSLPTNSLPTNSIPTNSLPTNSLYAQLLSNKFNEILKKEILLALLLALAGIVAFFIEGSIKKAPATISYCLITPAIAILLLIVAHLLVEKFRNSYFVRIFAGAGSNPLMSYVAFGSFVMPLFKLTGIIYIYEAAYPQGYPWVGVARAFVVVLFAMALVAKLSEKKIYWRA